MNHPKIWLRSGKQWWLERAIDDKGTLDISEIAHFTRLLPRTIIIGNERAFDDITIELIRETCGSTAGLSKDSAVHVNGNPMPGAYTEDTDDRSEEWIKFMMLPHLELPGDAYDLRSILFPLQHGKIPVDSKTYREIHRRIPQQSEKYLIEADHSDLPTQFASILQYLRKSVGEPAITELNVTIRLGHTFWTLFDQWKLYSGNPFTYEWLFNAIEQTGSSCPGSTKVRSSPNTLLTASDCTFVVGQEKFWSLGDAEVDLSANMQPLSIMFYGEVQFMLGYIVAGSKFQWVYIGKDAKVTKAGPRLDLTIESMRFQFVLSISYAYQLVKKMVALVPDVPGRHGVFTKDTEGDRVIYFLAQSVRKSIKNFESFCQCKMTELDVILKAYEAGESCASLPRARPVYSTYVNCGTYTVEISPLGHQPVLRCERDMKMMAKNVCEALSVLHALGLVHRDVRLPNILQVSKDQFVLIDLETVAYSPFEVGEGFMPFSEWSNEMYEGRLYTPMSDMYQLGRLLEERVPMSTESAQDFIRKLKLKQYSAELALKDPWLSDLIP